MCLVCTEVNETPTEPGYCQLYDEFGVHAYMGGRSLGRPGMAHMEDWTTCCDVDTPSPGVLATETTDDTGPVGVGGCDRHSETMKENR